MKCIDFLTAEYSIVIISSFEFYSSLKNTECMFYCNVLSYFVNVLFVSFAPRETEHGFITHLYPFIIVCATYITNLAVMNYPQVVSNTEVNTENCSW